MPIYVGYMFGYAIAPLGNAVTVPTLLGLAHKHFGLKKHISSHLITGGIFDGIVCIILFSVMNAVTISKMQPGGQNIGIIIAILIAQIVIGSLVGVACGLVTWPCKYIKSKTTRDLVKMVWIIMVILALGTGPEILGFGKAKYVGTLFFGYTCFRVWG